MLQVPVTSVLLAPADELLYVYDMARALSQLRYFAVTMLFRQAAGWKHRVRLEAIRSTSELGLSSK